MGSVFSTVKGNNVLILLLVGFKVIHTDLFNLRLKIFIFKEQQNKLIVLAQKINSTSTGKTSEIYFMLRIK